MIGLKIALKSDTEVLTKVQIRTFTDDNKFKPPGCSMEGPPGFDSLDRNLRRIQTTPYYRFWLMDVLSVGSCSPTWEMVVSRWEEYGLILRIKTEELVKRQCG